MIFVEIRVPALLIKHDILGGSLAAKDVIVSGDIKSRIRCSILEFPDRKIALSAADFPPSSVREVSITRTGLPRTLINLAS